MTIAEALAEVERDRIRERIASVKADQTVRGRYLGGEIPFGCRVSAEGRLVPEPVQQEAIREILYQPAAWWKYLSLWRGQYLERSWKN